MALLDVLTAALQGGVVGSVDQVHCQLPGLQTYKGWLGLRVVPPLPHLLFIGSKERVVVQVSRSDDVLTGVFRYEGSVRGSVQRSLTIQTDSKAELRT